MCFKRAKAAIFLHFQSGVNIISFRLVVVVVRIGLLRVENIDLSISMYIIDKDQNK